MGTIGIYALIPIVKTATNEPPGTHQCFSTLFSSGWTVLYNLQEGSDEGSETSTGHGHHLVGTGGGGSTVNVSIVH